MINIFTLFHGPNVIDNIFVVVFNISMVINYIVDWKCHVKCILVCAYAVQIMIMMYIQNTDTNSLVDVDDDSFQQGLSADSDTQINVAELHDNDNPPSSTLSQGTRVRTHFE